MMMIVLVVLGVMMVVSAFVALYTRDVVGAIVAAGAVSLLASVVYLMFGAPDVAMTEAAIGSALTTVVFLFAWSRIRSIASEKEGGDTEVNS
jgi:energy-converting hydrogenase B subunit D